MGFLSAYVGSEYIELGVDEQSGTKWYVEVKRSLTKSDMGAAERKLLQIRATQGAGSASASVDAGIDVVEYQLEMVAAAIVSWNLTDENDVLLPFQTKDELLASLRILPSSVFTAILDRVDKLNEPRTTAEKATFRDAGVGQPANEPNDTPDPGSVLAGTAAVGATGDPSSEA